MKKIFAVILVIVMVMSLCACTSNTQGNTASEEKPADKFVQVYEGDFTVIKTDWSTYQVYSSGTSFADRYVAVLEYNGTRILVLVSAEQYACWDAGDIVSGTLKRGSEEYYVSNFPVILIVDGNEFRVSWQGE